MSIALRFLRGRMRRAGGFGVVLGAALPRGSLCGRAVFGRIGLGGAIASGFILRRALQAGGASMSLVRRARRAPGLEGGRARRAGRAVAGRCRARHALGYRQGFRVAAAIVIELALCIWVVRTTACFADALKLRTIGDGKGRRASISKVLHEDSCDGRNVGAGNIEAGGSGADLRDEVTDLGRIKSHEFVNAGHAGIAHIAREAHLAVSRAVQEFPEELVEMGQQPTVINQSACSH